MAFLSILAFVFLISQGIVQLTFVGVMVTELFNRKRRDTSTAIWLAAILFFWLFFIGVSEYGLVLGGLPRILSWTALVSAGIALILFSILIIRKFSLINKVLTFSVGIVATAMFVAALIDRHAYSSSVTMPMILAVFFVAVVGSLVWIDILIKTSGDKK